MGNIDVGLSAVPQMSRSINLTNSKKTIPTRWVWNFAPYMRYRYKPNKTTSFGADYMGRSSQPTMAQLQPVADMSDPLRIIIGNPNLKPSFSHFIGLRFNNFNTEAQRSIMAMGHIQITQNSVASRSAYDPNTGGSTTTYENVNGSWNAFLMNMISMPLRNKAFVFSNRLHVRYMQSVGFNNNERNRSGDLSLSIFPSLAWRPANAELEIRPNYAFRHVTSSLQLSGQRNVHTYGGTFNATYYTPFGIVLNTDLNYSETSGYSAGYDTRQWMWNASISYQFLRNKAATISLRAYDLLQQKSNISRLVTATAISDNLYNSLTRYFMISFAYKFNTFGNGNQPTDRNARRFGPGGHGGPMGPPPGR